MNEQEPINEPQLITSVPGVEGQTVEQTPDNGERQIIDSVPGVERILPKDAVEQGMGRIVLLDASKIIHPEKVLGHPNNPNQAMNDAMIKTYENETEPAISEEEAKKRNPDIITSADVPK